MKGYKIELGLGLTFEGSDDYIKVLFRQSSVLPTYSIKRTTELPVHFIFYMHVGCVSQSCSVDHKYTNCFYLHVWNVSQTPSLPVQ